MAITIEKIPGAELNRRAEEERRKLATTVCLQNKITIPTGIWVTHEENVDYTIIDMTQATQEEQEAFMEERRQSNRRNSFGYGF